MLAAIESDPIMHAQTPPFPSAPADTPLASPNEAEQLIDRVSKTVTALQSVLEEETDLLRQGRLIEAAQIERTKAELAGAYLTDTGRIKSNLAFFKKTAPELLARMRERHEKLQGLLQNNLTVLATAHAVSESVIRGVTAEVARKTAPQVYGASGRTVTPARNAITPVAVSRTL